ncbi:hypothetical protein LPJGGPFB_01548 [Ensifer adhaerens]|nr:DoxX family protein [Ensifer adhaerens]NRP18317.1 hypothetical protein [Ensifer adhaerens]
MATTETWRSRSRIVLAVFYAAAGILHIALPTPFLSITPAWVPDAPNVILLTGVCEIAGAIGLLVPAVRRCAGIMLALYAICVFPANIKHALDDLGGMVVSTWQWLYHVPRLALQPFIVWLVLFAGRLLSWPFRRSDPEP